VKRRRTRARPRAWPLGLNSERCWLGGGQSRARRGNARGDPALRARGGEAKLAVAAKSSAQGLLGLCHARRRWGNRACGAARSNGGKAKAARVRQRQARQGLGHGETRRGDGSRRRGSGVRVRGGLDNQNRGAGSARAGRWPCKAEHARVRDVVVRRGCARRVGAPRGSGRQERRLGVTQLWRRRSRVRARATNSAGAQGWARRACTWQGHGKAAAAQGRKRATTAAGKGAGEVSRGGGISRAEGKGQKNRGATLG
jgi:hypothetical protein